MAETYNMDGRFPEEDNHDYSQTIAIQVNGAYCSETTHLVTLIVTNPHLPAEDHIEVKVSREGVIIERWDVANKRFVNAYQVTFATDFNGEPDDDYADEKDGDDDSVTTEGSPLVVSSSTKVQSDTESALFERLAFELPKFEL